jgi:hypothetical protein
LVSNVAWFAMPTRQQLRSALMICGCVIWFVSKGAMIVTSCLRRSQSMSAEVGSVYPGTGKSAPG